MRVCDERIVPESDVPCLLSLGLDMNGAMLVK